MKLHQARLKLTRPARPQLSTMPVNKDTQDLIDALVAVQRLANNPALSRQSKLSIIKLSMEYMKRLEEIRAADQASSSA